MQRSIRAFLCAAAVSFVAGCNYEVKEKSPVKSGEAPSISPEDRQKILDDENKRNEEAARRKKEVEAKASGKANGKKQK